MSQVKVSGNASGTGDFVIAAPNSNTNRTITLPDETGTVLVQSSSGTNMTLGTKYKVSGVATNALAWVNFNGTTGVRNASYNVSSVTVVSTGRWTITMTNALADANYCPQMANQQNATTNYSSNIVGLSPTTTSFDMYHFEGGSVSYPATNTSIFVVVFGN